MKLPRLILLSCALATPVLAANTFNVRDFGAVGDGVHLDTAAFTKAIAACANAGGGTVVVSAGRYLTGTVQLKSNLTLEIESGATLLGSPEPEDYVMRPYAYGGPRPGPSNVDGNRPGLTALIFGEDIANVTIRGAGTIDGGGAIWWERQMITWPGRAGPQNDRERAEAAKIRVGGRPNLVQFLRSQHIRMEGLTLRNSASWTVHPILCDYLNFTGLTLLNPSDSPNTDGIDPESCRNVHISDCHFDTGDDCITLKSGYDESGRKMNRPTENVTVTNCTMVNGHGAIVIGSEMSGGVRNVAVTNCVFIGTARGIRIKSTRGRGSVVENVVIENIVMQDVAEAFNITSFYTGGSLFAMPAAEQLFKVVPVNEGTPRFRNFRISHVLARNSQRAGQITGLPELPIEGLVLDDVKLEGGIGLVVSNGRDFRFHNVEINATTGPALAVRGVETFELDGFRTSQPHADAPVVDLTNVRDIFVRQCWALRGTGTFLRGTGVPPDAVTLEGNNFKFAREAVALTP